MPHTGYANHARDESLAVILRLEPHEVRGLNWEIDERDQRKPAKVAIPMRTRVCPHCVAETGAWQKHWVDPLCFICETHHTVMFDTDPFTRKWIPARTVPQFNRSELAAMRRSAGDALPDLVVAQQRLNQLRKSWTEPRAVEYASGSYLPETLILEALIMTRHTHSHNPDSPALQRWLQPALDHLVSAGRPLREEQSPLPDVNTLHGPTEHIAALAPQLITIVEEGLAGTRETLDDMLDEMFLEHRRHTWAVRRTLYQWASGRFAA